jgi:DNA-binding MarR family transcriptional regulator
MTELAAQTSLTPSGLTRSIDRLQQQGLVTRQTCPDDRRGAFAVLTEEGRDLMARVIPEHLAHVDAVLSSLFSPKEEDQLASSLRRLRDYTREQLGNEQVDDGGCPTA